MASRCPCRLAFAAPINRLRGPQEYRVHSALHRIVAEPHQTACVTYVRPLTVDKTARVKQGLGINAERRTLQAVLSILALEKQPPSTKLGGPP